MNESEFIIYIQNSILLYEEQKKSFIEKTSEYSKELRTQIVEIIENFEKKFIDFSETELEKIKEKQAKLLNKKLFLAKKEHENEIIQAENNLLSDLKIV